MGFDFWGAPVLVSLSIVALGKTSAYVCQQLPYLRNGAQVPFYMSVGLSVSVFMAISGLCPKPLAVQLSSVMHKLKGTHSQPKSKRPFNFHQIRPNLILGRQFRDEKDLNLLIQEHNVEVIVTLNEEWELFVPSKIVISALGDRTENRLRFAVPDYQAPTQDELDKTILFMKNHISNGKTVYVHCNAGRGRSATVVAAYLIATESKWKSASEVVRHMISLRPTVSWGLLDWPWRGQARAVATYFERDRANKKRM